MLLSECHLRPARRQMEGRDAAPAMTRWDYSQAARLDLVVNTGDALAECQFMVMRSNRERQRGQGGCRKPSLAGVLPWVMDGQPWLSLFLEGAGRRMRPVGCARVGERGGAWSSLPTPAMRCSIGSRSWALAYSESQSRVVTEKGTAACAAVEAHSRASRALAAARSRCPLTARRARTSCGSGR